MVRGIRILILSCLVFVIIANLLFYSFSLQGAYSSQWVYIKVFDFRQAHYEYRGFSYFYQYLSTFPGLTNSISTVSHVAAILSGDVSYTNITVLDALISIGSLLATPVQLIICFVSDLINIVIWLFAFFVPNWF